MSSTERFLIGSWTTWTGNDVDVYLLGEGELRRLELEWDRFPLDAVDELYYVTVILPAITRRVREYLERPGPALVVRA